MAETKSTQLTPRDLACLRDVGLQYAYRFDQLQRLFYQHTPEQDRYKLKPGTDSISIDRTYEIINKWLTLNLAEKKIILQGDKAWIWLTRSGLREVQLPFNYSGPPASNRLKHLYYINQIRLTIAAKRPDDLWQSEREIRKMLGATIKGENQPHAPDALLTNAANGKITAIEVECNAKTEAELENDLRELATTYRSIWYFTTKTTRRQIEKMLETFSPEMQKPFVLYDLTGYGHEYGL